MAITIDIPDEIERNLASHWPELSLKAKELMAVEGYRQGILSRGQVSELLDLSYWETEALLKERKANLHYGEVDLQHDLEALNRLASQ